MYICYIGKYTGNILCLKKTGRIIYLFLCRYRYGNLHSVVGIKTANQMEMVVDSK